VVHHSARVNSANSIVYMKRGHDGYKKDGQDKYMGGGQGNGGKDNGSGNGNTNTIQVLKQNAKASGKFSIVEQNGENSIL
jgi:hypothetical protein